jgi:membrane-associated phospholipid phosphatase
MWNTSEGKTLLGGDRREARTGETLLSASESTVAAPPREDQRLSPAVRFVLWWLGLTALAVCLDSTISGWTRTDLSEDHILPILFFFRLMGRYPIHFFTVPIVLSFPNRRRLAVGYGLAMIASTLLCEAIKELVGRARPIAHLGPFHFVPGIGPGNDMNSFPSGEATAAFALAALLAIYFPRSRWVFYVLAAVAAAARVAAYRHFPSDVVFGAGLGIGTVLLCVRLLGPRFYTLTEVTDPVRCAPETPRPPDAQEARDARESMKPPPAGG